MRATHFTLAIPYQAGIDEAWGPHIFSAVLFISRASRASRAAPSRGKERQKGGLRGLLLGLSLVGPRSG